MFRLIESLYLVVKDDDEDYDVSENDSAETDSLFSDNALFLQIAN